MFIVSNDDLWYSLREPLEYSLEKSLWYSLRNSLRKSLGELMWEPLWESLGVALQSVYKEVEYVLCVKL